MAPRVRAALEEPDHAGGAWAGAWGAPPCARVGRTPAVREGPRPPGAQEEERTRSLSGGGHPEESRGRPTSGRRTWGRTDGVGRVLPSQLTASEPVRPAAPGPAPRARPRATRCPTGSSAPHGGTSSGGRPKTARRATVGRGGRAGSAGPAPVAMWPDGAPEIRPDRK